MRVLLSLHLVLLRLLSFILTDQNCFQRETGVGTAGFSCRIWRLPVERHHSLELPRHPGAQTHGLQAAKQLLRTWQKPHTTGLCAAGGCGGLPRSSGYCH